MCCDREFDTYSLWALADVVKYENAHGSGRFILNDVLYIKSGRSLLSIRNAL